MRNINLSLDENDNKQPFSFVDIKHVVGTHPLLEQNCANVLERRSALAGPSSLMMLVLMCSELGSILGCRRFSAKAGMVIHHSKGIWSSPSKDTQLHASGLWTAPHAAFSVEDHRTLNCPKTVPSKDRSHGGVIVETAENIT